MSAHTMPKAVYDEAKQMAADGFGHEDIRVRLKLSEQVAKLIVLGKYSVRKAAS